MECRDIRFRISEWVDGDLKEAEITEVESHVTTLPGLQSDLRRLQNHEGVIPDICLLLSLLM